ncbi:uncharacterized protein EAE98_006880 [Botrytis deweyae]|uniref:Uncharacterized protein n=1 Tax=Botrytis deweyae TaxID=2478750 RepID=A0ABQ7IIZ4_9HELO|nr:uncharacterized protein EAE98_006880 [Botrytis deweyae]KAF7925655.1 hypothetical protein EAE98_006880 [Botrytis deweyae]
MPTTDMNTPSRFKRFLSPPIRWSKTDIESQQSQQSIIHSFQDPSPQMHHSTDHLKDQHFSQHDSIENRDSPSSYAVKAHDIQNPNTQSFTPNSRQTLTGTPYEDLAARSGNRNPYFNNFMRQRRREDGEIDLEGQYPSIQSSRNRLQYDLGNSFGDRHRRINDTCDQNSIPHFKHRVNESQSPNPTIQDAHQNTNPESTSASTQRSRRENYSENESSQAEPLSNPRDYTIDDIESQRFRAPKSPAIPIDLDFSGVIQTLRRPIDYFGANKEETKEMWQCVPNEDLEEGMLGRYAWNHEDRDVCVSCRRARAREARSRLVSLKRALGFAG